MTTVICNFQKKTIYQCYLRQQKFIDFILSCCATYDISRKECCDLTLDFSMHPIAQFLNCTVPKHDLENVCFVEDSFQLISLVSNLKELQIYVDAQLKPKCKIDDSLRRFLIENLLAPTWEFRQRTNKVFAKHGISNNYVVIFTEKEINDIFFATISKDRPIVFICPNKEFAARIAKKFEFILWNQDDDDILSAELLEFYLFSVAFKVHSFGNASQLLKIACEIFNLDFFQHNTIQFSYGIDDSRIDDNRVNDIRIDCTAQGLQKFCKNNEYFIKRNDNFNEYFGDVAVNREKSLRVTFEDKVVVNFPEIRSQSYLITQSD